MRELTHNDDEFIFRLLNEPSFIENIADKKVRNLEDARRYIDEGPATSYREHGFGLLLVTLKKSDRPIGICGLLKRPGMTDVEVGYAFLPEFWGRGYACEATAAAIDCGWSQFDLKRIVAITKPGNPASERVLERCGMSFEGVIELDGFDIGQRFFSIERE